ncbi:MAG TPA: SDR family NAD(P)-dependent oxidoreductase [Myxococcota bacterium]|nr:SDR family NAD(P)-dependent oxidoreductase [Myxococcales bacterium]HPG26084.1 SDR family NAD(P)-dependent oxidoreductase [Myxococcota bacterium]
MPPNPLPLEGRVAIVTGAGRGIGRATALALATRGAKVLVNDLGASLEGDRPDSTPAALVAREIEKAGGEARANGDSVADWPSARHIVESALDHFGRLDLLVNNAGLSSSAPIHEQDPDHFDLVVRSHLHGTFHCIRAAAPHLIERGAGAIVNVVSRAGLLGVPGQAAYGAGKGGVFALTNVAARDLGPHGIRVNAVNPAATETRMVTTAIDRFRAEGEAGAKMAAGLEAALQPPENIAALIAALCHDEAARFNGEIFYLEKGRVGLFDPLAVTQERTGDGAWTIDGLLEAITRFTPHGQGVIYADE